VGGSLIFMDSDGISIKGPVLLLEGAQTVNVKGKTIDLN
jgi:hypothetical protein